MARGMGYQWWVQLQCQHKGCVCKLLITRGCGGYGGLWWLFQNFFRKFPYIGTLHQNPPHPPHLTFSTAQVIGRQPLVQQWWVLSTHHKPTTTHHNPPLRFFNALGLLIVVFGSIYGEHYYQSLAYPYASCSMGISVAFGGRIDPAAPACQRLKSLRPEAPRQARPSVATITMGLRPRQQQQQQSATASCPLGTTRPLGLGGLRLGQGGRASLCQWRL